MKRKSANEWAEAYFDPDKNDKCVVIIAMAMAQARRDALQEAADIVCDEELSELPEPMLSNSESRLLNRRQAILALIGQTDSHKPESFTGRITEAGNGDSPDCRVVIYVESEALRQLKTNLIYAQVRVMILKKAGGV